ncbi:Hypothetical predicted protein [Olea europaea subsp. europaea]|uniref:Uncharacterized protein n=1 Tax=Olea europaea subsp. europaea TaxID=158383 RepID=A0A8S0QMX3_OLEEU|nr:Hypothetical predicted protein [Olea europaea subsp. europaea]
MADPNLPANNQENYSAPKRVSFGPYYHGKPEFSRVEGLKRTVLEDFARSYKDSFHRQISEMIGQIKKFYDRDSTAYDDEALAEMMLLDSSFAIYIMKIELGCGKTFEHSRQHLGIAETPFLSEDLILFKNQIPLGVIKLLCKLMHGNQCTLIYDFLSFFIFKKKELISRIPAGDERQPLHLLDASYQLLVKHGNDTTNAGEETLNQESSNEPRELYSLLPVSVTDSDIPAPTNAGVETITQENSNEYDRQSLSVTELKAKGINFKPSSYCLKDIKFESHKFYGQLQLPIFFFHANSKLRFTQMIEHEMTLENEYNFTLLCYVNFMKSLIVKSEDVKELREKRILFSDLDSDEQIVEVIKGIDTHGLGTDFFFDKEKNKIVKHCSSKTKTWIADLYHTHFRSPWTFISFLAATFLLCLTFLQTYYTMNPPK